MRQEGLPLPKKTNWILIYNALGLALILLLSIFVARLVLGANDPATSPSLQDTIRGMTPAQVHEEQQEQTNLVVLDVRTQEEWASGAHIPGAISVPIAELASLAPQLIPDKNTPIVVTCFNRNTRSHQAVELLREQGYTQVFNLDGGLEAWMDEGLPTEPFVIIEQGGG